MPRTLPWLTGSAGNGSGSSSNTPAKKSSTPRQQPAQSSTSKNDETPRPAPRKRDFFRSSPSPPSSPIHRCPSEEHLIEGLDNDDIYMMVEDEFYAVAQTFTQHLHYAEYVKRKKEAKLLNADAISQISRPTDGVTPMPAGLQRRETMEALKQKQVRGLERMGSSRIEVDEGEGEAENEDDDDDDDEVFAGTSLQGLMSSPVRGMSLVEMQGVKSTTRAAAGFLRPGSSREGVTGEETVSEDDEDDDLDAWAGTTEMDTPTAKRPQEKTVVRRATGSDSPLDRNSKTLRASSHARPRVSPQAKKHTTTEPGAKRRMLFDDEFDQLPELGSPDRVAQKSAATAPSESSIERAQKTARDNGGAKKSRLNEVPTFLL